MQRNEHHDAVYARDFARHASSASSSSAACSGAVVAADERVTKNDVLAWANRGMREDLIIERIERSNSALRLTAADENDLRDRGVSEAIIASMKETARR